MLSCDTIVLNGACSASHQNMFVKNSDRPLGEAQPLVFCPAGVYPEGSMLQCTDLTIPQAASTYATIGSKPYWIWGYEMGINEKGVVIGNEAQGSRNAAEADTGLLGMDLLRLGLERGGTAYEAMHIIIDLLTQYGQNANANPLYDRRYENSFILMDQKELWLLETAGREWAARRIKTKAGVSNCYTIETEFDECSPRLQEVAYENGWFSKSQPFHFAMAYTMPAIRQTLSAPRLHRLQKFLADSDQPFTFEKIKSITRDHFEGEINAPRFGAGYGTIPSVCMHAMTWQDSQTAASLICTYREMIGITGRYCFSTPCTSAYMPVYFTGTLPKEMQTGGEFFDENSMWWVMERLSMAVSFDSQRFSPDVQEELQELEKKFEILAGQTEEEAGNLLKKGRKEEAYALLDRLMQSCSEELMQHANQLYQRIAETVRAEGGLVGPRGPFLKDYSSRVKLSLF